jgi:DNA-binding LacI/PurR family transcriptional regulator
MRFSCQAISMVAAAMKPRVSIQDVADAAGVSITTVSHALNGKGRLSDATRDRVRAIAEDLQYHPQPSARSLAERRSGLIGLAVSHYSPGAAFALTDFAYFMQLMSAATEAALQRGYALVLVSGTGPTDAMLNLNLDGAIIVDPLEDDRLLRALDTAAVPVVTTGRAPGDPDRDWWIDNDHFEGTLSILRHLERAGARRLALINSPPVNSYALESLAAYERWCKEHGAEHMAVTAGGDLAEGAGFQAALELLDRPDPPDAIYATLDRLAVGVLLAASARGVVVPDELLVAGCTDSDAAKFATPALTALTLHPEEIGRRAVEMLAARIEGAPEPPRHVIVGTRVVARTSTRRRAAATPHAA